MFHKNMEPVPMTTCEWEAYWDSSDLLKRIPAWGHFTWLFQIHTNKALYGLKVAPQNGWYRAPWKAQHDCHGYYTTRATTDWRDKCWSGTKLEQTFPWGGPGNVDRPVNGLFNPLKVKGGSLKQTHSDRLCTHWDTKSTLSSCKGTSQRAGDENKIGKVGMCLCQNPSAWLFYFLASTILFWAQERDDLSLHWAPASILTESIYSFKKTVCSQEYAVVWWRMSNLTWMISHCHQQSFIQLPKNFISLSTPRGKAKHRMYYQMFVGKKHTNLAKKKKSFWKEMTWQLRL